MKTLERIRRLSTPEGQAGLLLRLSRQRFDRVVRASWNEINRDRNLTDDKDIFDEIVRDGIAIVPGFVTAHQLRDLQREVAAIAGLHDGAYEGPNQFRNLEKDGICALEITDREPCASQLTTDNDRLHQLASALFGARLTSSAILSKYAVDRVDSSNVPHWDDWRPRFKCFIYVNDVTEADAPMIYVRGSHERVPWRAEKDFASHFMPRASAGGSWWPVEELGLDQVTCVGSAGTLVAFDALGIHAGTQLTAGPRIMLMNMYTTHIEYSFRPY